MTCAECFRRTQSLFTSAELGTEPLRAPEFTVNGHTDSRQGDEKDCAVKGDEVNFSRGTLHQQRLPPCPRTVASVVGMISQFLA